MLKVFAQYFPNYALAQILADAVLLFVALMLAVLVQSHARTEDWTSIVPSALLFACGMVVLNSALGLYRSGADGGVLRLTAARVLVSLLVSIPFAFGIFAVLPWGYFASEALQLSSILLLSAMLVMRGLVNRQRGRPLFAPRVLVIGGGAEADEVAGALADPRMGGMNVVGFYLPADESEPECVVAAERILSAPAGLLGVVREHRVSDVVVAVKERRGGVLPIRELLDCKIRGVRVMDLSSFFEQARGQVRIDSLKASWLIYGDGFRQGVLRSFVKRVFDLLAGSVMLCLALPVMAITALCILLDDGAPVFFRQERVGRGGRVFHVIKFRSMRCDAEADGRPRWASIGDSRVTRIGHLIRRFRIDELPQLFNVLSGEMSLVGPRPERPFFVDQLTREVPFYSVRHSVKPGVTGWAQVRYHYGASVDDAVEKLQYDLYYVKNHTLVLDLLVLLETVRVVLTGEGAH